MRAPLPPDEPGRLAALYDAGVLDTPPEPDFDDIALLASEICDTPMGLVSLIDADRQWFKAKAGMDLEETRRDLSFCAHTIVGDELLEIPDAATDARFADNPYVSDGGVRFYAGAPVVLDGTHSVGTVCVVDHVPRELTDAQRRALRSLARHASAQLELRRTARRSAEVADRLRQLDRMKDSFLAGVSHEFRTPLSSINGYLEILQDGTYDAETSHRFLEIMQRNADRLTRLVDELLLIARPEGIRLEFDEVDLAALAAEVVAACRPLAGHKRVRLSEEGSAPVPVRGDSRHLTRALNHLIVNAIKFTPVDGEVTVRTVPGDDCVVIVSDTGIGIAEEDRPHIFDRFYRARASDMMAVQGPGLGLAIVKSIVEAHSGAIELESTPGAGTTVRVSLPHA